MKKAPLISCLCVTRNKVQLINRAINCFRSQTYPNKQLIVVYEDNDKHIREFMSGIRDESIRVYEIPAEPKLTLGELRNQSIKFSDGEYICQWDADDWFHNSRLEIQMDYLTKMHKGICFLTYWIIFDNLTKKAYLSRKRIWEGSMLCRKERLSASNIFYPNISKLEDFRFVEKLLENNSIYPVDLPNLYIYVYHGDNTWDYNHFEQNFKAGKAFSEPASRLINDILEGKYTNAQASELMSSPEILEQIEYDYEFY